MVKLYDYHKCQHTAKTTKDMIANEQKIQNQTETHNKTCLWNRKIHI